MKKGGTILLLGLTIAFIGFIIGMLVGRNIHKEPVTIQLTTESTNHTVVTLDSGSTVPAERININTASEKVLDTLPGIGPVLASRIVEYRQEHGPFQQTTDLSCVEGIGPEKLLAILDLITVED